MNGSARDFPERVDLGDHDGHMDRAEQSHYSSGVVASPFAVRAPVLQGQRELDAARGHYSSDAVAAPPVASASILQNPHINEIQPDGFSVEILTSSSTQSLANGGETREAAATPTSGAAVLGDALGSSSVV